MRLTSSEMPPLGALMWPSSEVPVPKAMIGVLCRAQSWTICLHLLGRFGEHHGVGQMRLVEGDVLAMLLAHGVRGAQPIAVELLQLGDGRVDVRGRG